MSDLGAIVGRMTAPQWVRDNQFEHMLTLWRADHANTEPDEDSRRQIRRQADDIADDIHRSQLYES